MPNYLLVYHGGKMPDMPESQAKVMEAWGAWMGGLGPNLVDGGNISGSATNTLTVSNVTATDGGSYSIIVSNTIAAVTNSATVVTIVEPWVNDKNAPFQPACYMARALYNDMLSLHAIEVV